MVYSPTVSTAIDKMIATNNFMFKCKKMSPIRQGKRFFIHYNAETRDLNVSRYTLNMQNNG